MSTPFAAALKAEIQRLARKEIKTQTASLKKAVTQLSDEVRALKKRLKESQSAAAAKRKAPLALAAPSPDSADGKTLRFRADGYKTLRARLELSAADMGLLTGVTGQTVYAREQGAKPRSAAELSAIAALRSMPKAKVQELLAQKRRSGAAAG